MCLAVLPGLAAGSSARAASPSAESAGCSSAIQAAERQHRIPARLLHSIGLVESGRAGAAGRPAASWPWTINVAGTGRYLESRSAAVAAVEQARGVGIHSIDVGCMQVNLLHHPSAFASLDQAFDPQVNANYAAAFLASLYRATGSWPAAAEAYHSRTPGLAAEYGRRVMAIWPLSGQYGAAPGAQARAAARRVDPHDVYTPEFRARVAADAARRAERDVALSGTASRRGVSLASSGAARGGVRPVSRQASGPVVAPPGRPLRSPLRS